MKKKKWLALPVILIAVFLVAGGAHAQATYARPAGPVYFGIFGGAVFPQDMTWTSNATGVSADLSLDNSGMFGVKVGFILPQARMLALEVEYNHMFNQTIPSQVVTGVRESGDVYLDNLMFNVLLRYPEGRIHPFIGAGIGGSSMNINNTESTPGGVVLNVASESQSAFAWQFLAGINFEIAPNLSAEVTYRYFGTNPNFTAIDVDYKAQAVTAGLNFHF